MAEKKTLKEKIKSIYKKVEDIAATGALGTGGAGIKKKEKRTKGKIKKGWKSYSWIW